jgi:hypothetical protein
VTTVGEVPGAQVSATEFRHAMGHFVTGVTVITSLTADGSPVGTTANAVTSLSLDPPLVLVCFDLDSQTLRAIRGRGAFAVNVLAAAQRHLSANFARRGLGGGLGRGAAQARADREPSSGGRARDDGMHRGTLPARRRPRDSGRPGASRRDQSRAGRAARLFPRQLCFVGFMSGESASGDGGAAWNPAPGDRSTPAARTCLMRVAAMPRAAIVRPPMTSSTKWLAEARTTNVVAAG